VLCVPLEVRGEVIALCASIRKTSANFTKNEDMQFLSVLASLPALAIENARLYENLKSTYMMVVMGALWWHRCGALSYHTGNVLFSEFYILYSPNNRIFHIW